MLAERDILKDLCEAKSYIVQESQESFQGIEKDILKGFCELKFQASENKTALLLDSCQNQNALQKQISDCCCELKEKIDMRGNQTDALINNLEQQRLREQLQACKTESLINSIVKVALGGNGK